jgi:hypothetical protein
VVAIKPLVASTLLALLLASAAVASSTARADNPTLKINADDQAWATQSLLRPGDFGIGWKGGQIPSVKPVGPSCPGFDPKASDLVVTGHANANFEYPRAGVQVSLDSQVLDSVAAVQKDFARTIQPPLAECLAYQLRRGPNITAVTVTTLEFPRIGSNSAAYRALITVKSKGRTAKVISDFVFFSNGRLEYSLNVVAPVGYRRQLVPFEADMARMLVKRGARPE